MRKVNGFELPRILVPAITARLEITRAQARSEVRRGNWQPLARGVVLTRPDDPTREDWATVGLAIAGRSAAVSGWDALRVRGVGPPRPPTSDVLVLTRTGRSRTIGSVHIRRTDRPYPATRMSAEHPTLAFASIAAAARAVADTGLQCNDLSTTRALVASAVQKRTCTLADIAAELDAGPQNQSRFLREAVQHLGDGARSEAEVRAARKLARVDVPPFELNVPIVDEWGVVLFVVDVFWRELRAGLEVDSRECHFTDAEWQATLARHNALTRYGLAVTHYPPSRIGRRGDPWLAEVADWLRRRAAELGVPVRHGSGVIALPSGAEPEPFRVRVGRRAA